MCVGYADREQVQRRALKLFKKYRNNIGIEFKLDRKKRQIASEFWNKKDAKDLEEPPKKRQRVSQQEDETDEENEHKLMDINRNITASNN